MFTNVVIVFNIFRWKRMKEPMVLVCLYYWCMTKEVPLNKACNNNVFYYIDDGVKDLKVLKN